MSDMTNTFRVVTANVTHAELLATLHAAAFEKPWSARALMELLVAPGAFALLVNSYSLIEEVSDPLGFILCRVAADECEVLTIAVIRAFRRRGIGRRLLSAAAAHAAKSGARVMYLEVAVDNDEARKLYESAGFALAGHRSNYYRSAKDCVTIDAAILRRTLTA